MAQQIGQAIDKFLKSIKQVDWKKQQLINKVWPLIIGQKFSPHTRIAGIKQRILQVEVESTVFLHELANFKKEKILKKLQEKFPQYKFRDIKFFTGR